MKMFVLVGLVRPPAGKNLDPADPHVVVGAFPAREKLEEFLHAGGLPREWPYYAVVEEDGGYYVLASRELGPSEMALLSAGSDPRWKDLLVAAGPFEDLAEAQKMRAVLAPIFAGVLVGTLTEESASQLKKWEQ